MALCGRYAVYPWHLRKGAPKHTCITPPNNNTEITQNTQLTYLNNNYCLKFSSLIFCYHHQLNFVFVSCSTLKCCAYFCTCFHLVQCHTILLFVCQDPPGMNTCLHGSRHVLSFLATPALCDCVYDATVRALSDVDVALEMRPIIPSKPMIQYPWFVVHYTVILPENTRLQSDCTKGTSYFHDYHSWIPEWSTKK